VKIISGWWTILNGNLKVVFAVRDGPRKRILYCTPDTLPYFYVTPASYQKYKSNFSTSLVHHTEQHRAKNGTFIKIYTNTPDEVKILRDQLPPGTCYEADIPFVRRCMIDSGISLDIDHELHPLKEPDTHFRKLYYDIECDNRLGFPDPLRDRILSIATMSDDGTKAFFSVKDCSEKEMLQRFLNYASDYDLLIAWNAYNFDEPYIKERCRINQVKLNGRQWQWLDLMFLYKKAMWRIKDPQPSYSLDHISSFELGETKLDLSQELRLWQLFEQKFDLFKKYNEKDVELVMRIDKKNRVTDRFIDFASLTGLFVGDTKYYSRLVDILVLRRCHKENLILGTKQYGRKAEDYAGGLCFEPKPGIYEDVVILDFTSLYPSIIQAFNISFETLDPSGEITVPTTDIHYAAAPGVMPALIADLQKMRRARKAERKQFAVGSDKYIKLDMRQYTLKVLMNTMYGYFGDPSSRIFSKTIAQSITAAGRWLLSETKFKAQKMGYEILYGDTDSIFIQISGSEDPLKQGARLARIITAHLRTLLRDAGASGALINLKFEKYCSKILLSSAKKKYILKIKWQEGQTTDILKIQGMESKRGDWSSLARETQHNVIVKLMNGSSLSDITQYVESVRRDLFKGRLDHKLIVSKSISKALQEYASPPIQARVAERCTTRKYYPGDKVPYIICGYRDGKLYGISPEEMKDVENKKPIYYYYWKFQVVPPLKRLLSCAFKDLPPIFTSTVSSKLKRMLDIRNADLSTYMKE